MKIKAEILKRLSEAAKDKPFEIGGILGMNAQNIVTEVAFDIPKCAAHPCEYCPNVQYLNKIIAKWQMKHIAFCGIFHTHFADVNSLSAGDKKYIKEILLAMPAYIKKLYFPIYTIPGGKLWVYAADMDGGDFIIQSEKAETIE